MGKDIKCVEGSGNVFADLGVRDPQGARVRAELAREVALIIAKRGLRQMDVAKILEIDRAKVSKLTRGRISGFSSDRLFRYLEALGCDVKITVRENKTVRARGRVEVVGA